MVTIERPNLTVLERRILELYSQGLEYELIQSKLMEEFSEDLSGKRLGYKMGRIKRKMNCQTQFELGCLYTQDLMNRKMELLKQNHENEKVYIESEQFRKGKHIGIEIGKNQPGNKDNSLYTGIGIATIFWLAIAYGFYYASYFN